MLLPAIYSEDYFGYSKTGNGRVMTYRKTVVKIIKNFSANRLTKQLFIPYMIEDKNNIFVSG
jgi:hypothetical protein